MARARVVIFGWAPSVHIKRWSRGLTDRGYQVKVVSLGGKPLPGVETVILPRKGRWSYLTSAGKAVAQARKFKPDLLHAHYAAGFGIWALRAKIQPTVISVWGSDVMDRPKNPFLTYHTKRALTKAAYVTATSDILRRSAIEFVPSVANKIQTIPFGVTMPTEWIEPPPHRPLKICWVKQLFHKYGPDLLIRAIRKVKDSIPDIEVNLAGDGDMEDQLHRMISDLQLEDNVHLRGWISNKDIYRFIQEHHLLVMPSRKEAFGVAVLEAAACRRPVIASDVGGVPEVLVDNVTGILVPKDDVDSLASAIIRLANDADLREQMGQAGYRFVEENYTWEKSLDMMSDLYERLLHEKK